MSRHEHSVIMRLVVLVLLVSLEVFADIKFPSKTSVEVNHDAIPATQSRTDHQSRMHTTRPPHHQNHEGHTEPCTKKPSTDQRPLSGMDGVLASVLSKPTPAAPKPGGNSMYTTQAPRDGIEVSHGTTPASVHSDVHGGTVPKQVSDKTGIHTHEHSDVYTSTRRPNPEQYVPVTAHPDAHNTVHAGENGAHNNHHDHKHEHEHQHGIQDSAHGHLPPPAPIHPPPLNDPRPYPVPGCGYDVHGNVDHAHHQTVAHEGNSYHYDRPSHGLNYHSGCGNLENHYSTSHTAHSAHSGQGSSQNVQGASYPPRGSHMTTHHHDHPHHGQHDAHSSPHHDHAAVHLHDRPNAVPHPAQDNNRRLDGGPGHHAHYSGHGYPPASSHGFGGDASYSGSYSTHGNNWNHGSGHHDHGHGYGSQNGHQHYGHDHGSQKFYQHYGHDHGSQHNQDYSHDHVSPHDHHVHDHDHYHGHGSNVHGSPGGAYYHGSLPAAHAPPPPPQRHPASDHGPSDRHETKQCGGSSHTEIP